ncbi:hypothetical protein PQR16_26915 [Caballeronia glebae]|uniref:phage tail assembly protein T n=1 Tax=Caballeronia glebae TaxID=1777143 RepID=UPI0038BA019D
MASYQLDQRGGHYDDLRAGAIASMLANINRDTKVKREPFGSLDFIPWNEMRQVEAEEVKPVLLDDADAHSELLLSMMFPNKAN